MSPSSEADDAGREWFSYRRIASLKHYIVLSQEWREVAQERREVAVHSRAGGLWRTRFVTVGAVELDDRPAALEIDALYAATDIAA